MEIILYRDRIHMKIPYKVRNNFILFRLGHLLHLKMYKSVRNCCFWGYSNPKIFILILYLEISFLIHVNMKVMHM